MNIREASGVFDTIPVIDLSQSFSPEIADKKKVARQIGEACRNVGFFYVISHGIEKPVLSAQLDHCRRFFALPQRDKDTIRIGATNGVRGYEPLMTQTLDAGTPSDLKESLMLGPEPGPGAGGPENRWPRDLPGFREQMTVYTDQVMRLGRHLMRLLALSLDLEEEFFDESVRVPACTVRLLHYPPYAADAPADQLGAGAHTDWGAITILLQDTIGGLEVQTAAGDWVSAPPIDGAFVINLGDLIRRWTNDLYLSNPHRVLSNRSGRDRYSVATFFNPHRDYRVECLPTCLPGEGAPTYPPCTVGEHTDEMYRITYGINL